MVDDPLGGPANRALAILPEGPVRRRLLESINLLDNYTRGLVAEVLVAELVDGALVGSGYGSWDVELGAVRIEVKASGAIQSWPQTAESRPSFSIARSTGWFEQPDGSFVPDERKMRRSDVYVFCHHRGYRPDIAAEWTFFVVPTNRIDDRLGDQRSITLSAVRVGLQSVECNASQLEEAVLAAADPPR